MHPCDNFEIIFLLHVGRGGGGKLPGDNFAVTTLELPKFCTLNCMDLILAQKIDHSVCSLLILKVAA